MVKKTQTQRLVEGLLKIGCRELVSPSRKYRAFESELGGRVYFVGKAGALRSNEVLRVSDSVSMERTMAKRKLLASVPE